MLAYRMVAWEQSPELVEVERPTPGPGEVLVKVAGTGLCHSDITMMGIPESIGTMIDWHMPFTLGHEVGGWVEDVGDDVVGVGPGDPVAVVSAHSCGSCSYCRRGQDSLCEVGLAGRGYGRDGGLAEFMLVGSSRELVPLGSLDPKVAGPLTDAGATSYHGVTRVLPKLVPGATAVVIGAGGLGAYAVQFLKALSPARIVAVDTDPERLAFARELGAHETITGVDKGTSGAIRTLTDGEGADAVLDFVGIDATIDAGLASVRKGGSFALVGAGGGRATQPWYGGLPREAEIFTYQGATAQHLREVVALADAGLIRSYIDEFPVARVADAYAALEAGTLRGRAVVTF